MRLRAARAAAGETESEPGSEMDDVWESILGKTYDLVLPAQLTPAPPREPISQSDSEPGASPAETKHICSSSSHLSWL